MIERQIEWPIASFYLKDKYWHIVFRSDAKLAPINQNGPMPILSYVDIPSILQLQTNVLKKLGLFNKLLQTNIENNGDFILKIPSSLYENVYSIALDSQTDSVLPNFAYFETVLKVVILDYIFGINRPLYTVYRHKQTKEYCLMPIPSFLQSDKNGIQEFLHKSILPHLFGLRWYDHVKSVSNMLLEWLVVKQGAQYIAESIYQVKFNNLKDQKILADIRKLILDRLEHAVQWVKNGCPVLEQIIFSIKINNNVSYTGINMLDKYYFVVLDLITESYSTELLSDLIDAEKIPVELFSMNLPVKELLNAISQWLTGGLQIVGLAIPYTLTDSSLNVDNMDGVHTIADSKTEYKNKLYWSI